ncbi:DUF2840 domain-containing protein [Sphingopyxis yananensis]|uniref:DUF2840 domain-containing protein n=1 Tax=Sphingopyxis yananensis TaxID=2886687 RepID=UPI001D111F99|nr:DUF2840 domain-containing protein [Sphingopyxis yananensis]MCC2602397.1 DUF2840 domain-containing protein [Sphingopyxis yananensis]
MSAVSFQGGATVDLLWIESRVEHWIRFGRVAEEQVLDRRRRRLPGSVFAFIRWVANDYGTAMSRIDIVRTVRLGEGYQTIPSVNPGGELLLRQSGWPKVQRVLEAIVDALRIDPADVAPDHWRHVHNRMTAHDAPRAYTVQRHDAWLAR